jgi:hypothetical protein
MSAGNTGIPTKKVPDSEKRKYSRINKNGARIGRTMFRRRNGVDKS